MTLREFAQKVAVVSQYSPVRELMVADYVMLGRMPHYQSFQLFESRRDIQEAVRVMNLVGISHLKHRMLHQISGGERRLAAIAKALAQSPKLLILDEPVAHLDLSRQVEVLSLIRRLNGELGITVVMVMHEINLAIEFCTRMAVMKDGTIVTTGSPEEVVSQEMARNLYGPSVYLQTNPFSHRPMLVIKGPINQ
jgi:iron complex transport system ATP-binding protein